jgi:hypothetical protein
MGYEMKLIKPEANPFDGQNPDQAQIIKVLQDALSAAERGLITSVAVISVSEGGFNATSGGRQAADLYLGCGAFMSKIVSVFNQGGGGGSIIKVRNGRGN